jgi:hypothetical protein
MPMFIMPSIYPSQPIICSAIANKSFIGAYKKKILDAVLWSKEGSILVKIGSCDLRKEKVDSELTQEAVTKLRDELGCLGILTTIITGDLDLESHRYPVYLLASGGGSGKNKTEISPELP